MHKVLTFMALFPGFPFPLLNVWLRQGVQALAKLHGRDDAEEKGRACVLRNAGGA